jgi:cyanate permease
MEVGGHQLYSRIGGSRHLHYGLYLYYLRRRHRILYGLMELAISVVLIGVSLALAWENILPSDVPQLSEKDFSVLKLVPWVAKLNIVLPIAAAIYVFVRGLDNIGEGLKRFPVMAAQWDDAFPTSEIAKEREARNNK